MPLPAAGRPVMVIAHRGSSAAEPEHTLTAYRRAMDEGVDALECDVRLTRDGHLVCVHDRRVNRTSNGRGAVSRLELADLAELDFASWHLSTAGADGVEEPDRDARSVLTLHRLLEVVTAEPRPVDIAIETKHPSRYAGQVEQVLAALLTRFGLNRLTPGRPQARVMSFSSASLRRMAELTPEVERVLLVNRATVLCRGGAVPPATSITGAHIALLRHHPGFVRRVQASGGRVHVWTVDKPADVATCVALGVDAIITNRPRAVLEQLGR